MKNIATTKVSPSKSAAVLVPLCLYKDKLSLVFTVRSMQLKSNRGQIAYPGGMADDSDKSLEETAVRESEEEIGLARSKIEIWGAGPSIGREDMHVTPYLAFVGHVDPSSLKLNPAEVEQVHIESLETLCNPAYFRTTHFRSKNGNYMLPVFITPSFRTWGLTALITHTMLHALLPSTYTNKIQLQVMTSKRLPSTKKP